MPTLLETAATYLQNEEWPFETDPERNVLVGNANGDNGTWRWHLIAIEDDEDTIVRIYSALPVNVPELRRPAIAELLTRINESLGSGNFEMDFADGQVRVKTTLDLMDGTLTQAMLMRIFMINLSITDQNLQTIMGVAFGGWNRLLRWKCAMPRMRRGNDSRIRAGYLLPNPAWLVNVLHIGTTP